MGKICSEISNTLYYYTALNSAVRFRPDVDKIFYRMEHRYIDQFEQLI
jgi:hypothetical protein